MTQAAALVRCSWPGTDELYVAYHDQEWGQPVHGDRPLFERLALEGFQSGLSWLTILRRRPGFRTAFADFDPHVLADYTEADVERLLADPGIIRHRGKIEATLSNARLLRSWIETDGEGALDAVVWSYAPAARPRPRTPAEIPAQTPESVALATDLRRRGWRFLGPTTAYAAMQACGLVDDHLADCHVVSPAPA